MVGLVVGVVEPVEVCVVVVVGVVVGEVTMHPTNPSPAPRYASAIAFIARVVSLHPDGT